MSTTIDCRARWHGEIWVASIPQHNVYGSGRTLNALHDDLTHGLSLMGVTAQVAITPASPELDRLRRAAAAYETALADAVTALTTQGSTVRDTAAATGVPVARVTALRARAPTPLTRRNTHRETP
ncbi:hypothetical protein NQK81_02525 [Amycolatopsis roodepoortensis]|uniref:hypothetical protein n=1 Tax=Amycolatopsis roodepoortensis TaxID=700274 RepID=UPI00214C655F|nr:hypothetical protein [Amycolatopsis roodepoortensis]UUV32349.1 hypothetical protein NQK81_02525 [Amycolatopsis roodepoortensis]